MAYDAGLAERLHDHFQHHHELTVKKMFGGLCFLVSQHMCCAIIGDKLMARVGPNNYADCLSKPRVSEMDFTGKPVKGLVYIAPNGFESDIDLTYWVNICVTFANSLPPKLPKKNKLKKKRSVIT